MSVTVLNGTPTRTWPTDAGPPARTRAHADRHGHGHPRADGARLAIDAAAEPPSELYRERPLQVLDDGEVAYLGGVVCASEEDGLPCWNAQTGHGVFMSRGGYQTF